MKKLEIKYSKQALKFLKKQEIVTQKRIIGAVSIMSDRDADIFWHIIQKHFTAPDLFTNIEEVEPDEVDLMMLKEIENNPDCHEFISQEELMKELNL